MQLQATQVRIPDPGRSLVVEFIGAFTLTFAGVSAIAMLGGVTDGGSLVAVGLAHGLAIGLMVAAMGHISGGHYNPAITVGMYLAGKIDAIKGALYVIAQLLGAVAAAALLKYILDDVSVGGVDAVRAGAPALADVVDNGQGLVLEGVMTFLLMTVVIGTAVDERNFHRPLAGLAIGLTITMDWFLGGPLTGAAMNPSRSFGPELIANEWTDWWVYWVGPVVGAAAAALLYTMVIQEKES